MASRTRKIAPEFTRTERFISRFTAMDEHQRRISAVWAMGTWCFSPACTWPYTFPYLYVTAPAGGGKSVFGQDVMGSICRERRNATGATGPTLFRMVGRFDPEEGIIENEGHTLVMDEIDMTFSGHKDPETQQSLNVGYKISGSTIPRAFGKSTIDFPCYAPHILLGIDNGHLPETVRTRCIRIDLRKLSADELETAGIEDFLPWEVDEESADLRQDLSDWAKDNSKVTREYKPVKPEGLTGRQWEIGRTLLQLAHAIGNEDAVRESLVELLNRAPKAGPEALYSAIFSLFQSTGYKLLTTNQILEHLTREGIAVPGQSGKGLMSVLGADGIQSRLQHLPKGHKGIPPVRPEVNKGQPQPKQRGYQLLDFDSQFTKFGLYPDTEDGQ